MPGYPFGWIRLICFDFQVPLTSDQHMACVNQAQTGHTVAYDLPPAEFGRDCVVLSWRSSIPELEAWSHAVVFARHLVQSHEQTVQTFQDEILTTNMTTEADLMQESDKRQRVPPVLHLGTSAGGCVDKLTLSSKLNLPNFRPKLHLPRDFHALYM